MSIRQAGSEYKAGQAVSAGQDRAGSEISVASYYKTKSRYQVYIISIVIKDFFHLGSFT